MKKVALVVGHDSFKDGGAVNPTIGISEFRYNQQLVTAIFEKLQYSQEVEPVIVYRTLPKFNGSETETAKKRAVLYSEQDNTNAQKPDFILFFHCNSAESLATVGKFEELQAINTGAGLFDKVKKLFDTPDGSEILIYRNAKTKSDSVKGRKMAEILLPAICKTLGTKNRGIKPISDSSQRGWASLERVSAPAVLLEPFFLSDSEDTLKGIYYKEELAETIASCILKINREVFQ